MMIRKIKANFLKVDSFGIKNISFYLQNIAFIFAFSKIIKGDKTVFKGRSVFIKENLSFGVNGLHSIFNDLDSLIENYGEFEVLGHADIGKGTKLYVGRGAKLSIGNNSFITGDTKILCHQKIFIGENCAISWGVTILDSDYHSLNSNEISKEINIGDNCWICSDVKILKGVNLPNNTIVAANSVVTKSYNEENTLIGGNPAKVIARNVYWKR